MLKCANISGYITLTAVKMIKCDPRAHFLPFLVFIALLLTLENRVSAHPAGKSLQTGCDFLSDKAHKSILVDFPIK